MITTSVATNYAQSRLNVAFQPAARALDPAAAALAREIMGFLDMAAARGGAGQAIANPLNMALPAPEGYHRMVVNGLGGTQAAVGAQLSQAPAGQNVSELLRALSQQVGSTTTQSVGTQAAPGTVQEKPTTKDRFATTHTCRGNRASPTNLNNSPHVKLAIYDILSHGKKSMKPEALAKELESKYGIHAEVTTVKDDAGKTHKALKFDNGDVFADANGNGVMDLRDYDFKGAIADLKERYGADVSVAQLQELAGGGQAQGVNPAELFAQQAQAVGGNRAHFPLNDITRLFSNAFNLAA